MTAISVYVERLTTLNELICNEQTGTLEDIGEELGVRKRQVAVYLNALNDLGRKARYNAKKKSFVYTENSKWNIVWPKN